MGRALPLLLISAVASLLLSACGGAASNFGTTPPPSNDPPPMLALSNFVMGLNQPVGFESANDGSGRIFILEQAGRIRIIQNGSLLPTAFLDISSKVESGGEEGLLGLAFSPSFNANGKFYVDYTMRSNTQLQTVIAEYQASPPSSNTADPSTERVLLVVDQPFANHNGGQLAFGPDDGDLYIAFGDGGSGGDPQGNAQNTNALLGKILRIDVISMPPAGKQYAIPLDNPFRNGGGAPEIFAYGLRNPWRFSFDPPSHRLFAGDVGQDNWEEVDIITNGGNYGWNILEGNHCYPPSVTSCNMTGLVPPITEYDHSSSGGISIIGGFMYRGSAIPGLVGTYVFGDLASGNVWGIKEGVNGSWQRTLLLKHNLEVSSFGRDASGELYLVDYGDGAVLHLVAAP
jgi:glucose/arabinose dehydrogenase